MSSSQELRAALEQALTIYERDGHAGATTAIIAAFEYLETLDDIKGRGLTLPLIGLAQALVDLDKGSVAPMLKAATPANRKQATTDKMMHQAWLAATVDALHLVGMSVDDAAKQVARRTKLDRWERLVALRKELASPNNMRPGKQIFVEVREGHRRTAEQLKAAVGLGAVSLQTACTQLLDEICEASKFFKEDAFHAYRERSK